MIKVLFYAPLPPPYAGPEVSTQIILENFQSQKIQLVHIKSNIRTENWQKGRFDLAGIAVFFKNFTNILNALVKQKIDVVYYLLSANRVGCLRDFVVVLTAKLFRKKVIAHYRGGNFHNFYLNQPKFHRFYLKLLLIFTNKIIVQSKSLISIFTSICVENNKLEVLPNGLNSSDFLKMKSINNKAGTEFTFLFLGHISFHKGFYDLIEAYKMLTPRYNIKLKYGGTKKFGKNFYNSEKIFLNGEILKFYELHKKEIHNTIEDFVRDSYKYNAEYLGVVSGEEKLNTFLHSDVLILPSYTEGFPMVVLEAMAFGLPVIVSRIGALIDIIKEGENGFFVEAGNVESIVDKMEYVINHKDILQTISLNNMNYVRKEFNITKIVRQFEEIIIKAMQNV